MKRRLIVGLFILLVLGIAIWLLYRSGFREGLVILEVEASEVAFSGQEIEYKVRVENKNKTDLIDVRLSFFYPENSIPLNEKGQGLSSLIKNLDLEALREGEQREFIFKAVLTGEKGEIKKAKADLTYTPSNIRSVFKKSSEAATTISRTAVSLILSAPPNVLPGQSISVSLDIRNESGEELKDSQVVFSYPDGFIFKRANPSPNEGSWTFSIISLKPNEGMRITVEGEISGFEKEGKRFEAVLRKNLGGQFFDFQKTQTLLTVATPLITADVSVNGSKDYLAKPADKLKYTIKFSNNSNYHFSALELNAKLEGQLFDFSSLKSTGFFDQGSSTILWNAAAEPLLASLAPNQNGEVSFEISLKNEFPKVFGKNYSVKVGSLIQTSSVPSDFGLEKISAAANLITKIKSETEFTSRAIYNDSVFPNSGPEPPKVGQKTTYTIHWRIVNEGNDLTNARIVSSLLPGITWENKFRLTPTQSDFNFNPSTGQISWTVPTVPAGSGIVSPVFEAVFQVGITPAQNQANQNVEITKETVFEAVDNFTKESVKITEPAIRIQVRD